MVIMQTSCSKKTPRHTKTETDFLTISAMVEDGQLSQDIEFLEVGEVCYLEIRDSWGQPYYLHREDLAKTFVKTMGRDKKIDLSDVKLLLPPTKQKPTKKISN